MPVNISEITSEICAVNKHTEIFAKFGLFFVNSFFFKLRMKYYIGTWYLGNNFKECLNDYLLYTVSYKTITICHVSKKIIFVHSKYLSTQQICIQYYLKFDAQNVRSCNASCMWLSFLLLLRKQILTYIDSSHTHLKLHK